MKNLRNFNPIVLANLSKILFQYAERGNVSFLDAYKLAAKHIMISAEKGCYHHISIGINEMALQILTYLCESFKKDGIDYSNREINKLLRDIKAKLPEEYRTLNAESFLKILRDAVAHNSQNTKNISAENLMSYKLNLPRTASSEKTQLTIACADMLDIMFKFDNARKLNNPLGGIEILDDYNLIEALLKLKKRGGKFSSVLLATNKKEGLVEIDEYQERAFARFLIQNKSLINGKNFNYVLTRFFPFKENGLNNYEFRCRLLKGFLNIAHNKFKTTNNELLKTFKMNNDFCGEVCFANSNFLKSILYSAMCFNMFASRTKDDLLPIFESAGLGLSNDEIRHLRNSFIHGRYFFNFKDGFEVYDGTKNLEHFLTFNFEEIEKLYEAYTEEQRQEIIDARIEKVHKNLGLM